MPKFKSLLATLGQATGLMAEGGGFCKPEM